MAAAPKPLNCCAVTLLCKHAAVTRRMLRKRLWAIILVLTALVIALSLVQLGVDFGLSPEMARRITGLSTTSVPLIAGIAAVVIADWFKQRSEFVSALRQLWGHMIEAKVDCTAFVSGDPEVSYSKASRTLSRAIDEVRGVYRNVGESETSKGFFPYEPLHDMRRVIATFQHATTPMPDRDEARERIDHAWQMLRRTFLVEFAAPEPPKPFVQRTVSRPS